MSEPRRHLAYHVYPVKDRWQQGIDQLLRRKDLFTGSKFIAVAQDPGLKIPDEPWVAGQYPVRGELDSWETVADYAVDLGAYVFPVRNDPSLREVTTWEPLWRKLLAVAAPSDFAFYAHAKGVTRPAGKWAHLPGWIDTLYAANLDYWPHVERLLQSHPIAGAFLKPGPAWGPGSGEFHFAGTFFWVRVREFRQRFWVPLKLTWAGTEMWPGLAYRLDEAGCVFDCPLSDLADGDNTPAWRAWVEEREKECTARL